MLQFKNFGSLGPLKAVVHLLMPFKLFKFELNGPKVCVAFVFWASDPLIDIFYKNLLIKGSEAQKQWPNKHI